MCNAGLVSTDTFGLALASEPWGTSAATTGGEIVWRNSSVCNHGLLGCFAGNFCPAALTMSC